MTRQREGGREEVGSGEVEEKEENRMEGGD